MRRNRSLLWLVLSPLALLALVAQPAGADQPFTVSIDAPAAKVGAQATAHVKLVAGQGLHVNKDYPTSLKLVAPAGVDLAKANLTGKDGHFEEKEATFDVTYTPKQAGKKTITGTFSFAVCSASSCDPHKTPVSFTVDVK